MVDSDVISLNSDSTVNRVRGTRFGICKPDLLGEPRLDGRGGLEEVDIEGGVFWGVVIFEGVSLNSVGEAAIIAAGVWDRVYDRWWRWWGTAIALTAFAMTSQIYLLVEIEGYFGLTRNQEVCQLLRLNRRQQGRWEDRWV